MISQKINLTLVMFICPVLLLFLLLLPLCSYAGEKFYTIQVGSFVELENAQKQFDYLKQKLDESKLDYLRIEKFKRYKRYYRLRLGKFEDKLVAKNFLQTVSSLFPGAIILKDSIINENIVRHYQKGLPLAEYDKTKEESTSPVTVSEAKVPERKPEEKPIGPVTTDEVMPEKVKVKPSEPEVKDARVYIKKLLTEGRYEEAIKAYREAIGESKDNRGKAILHKELGDLFVSKDDLKNAAEEFIQALSLYRLGFSEKERLQMAVYISWDNRLDGAISEIRSILSDNPQNTEARIHLARLLSWNNELNEAIKEADRVLKESPDNKDALLVKANALRWKGDVNSAIPMYTKLLEKEENFDARLGLTYALLLSGDKKGAEESRNLLKPKFPYQERELKKLIEDMEKATKPNVETRYSYYEDSEDNRLNRYSLSFGFWAGNWKSDINYRYTDARSNTLNNMAQDLFIKTYSKLTGSFGIGGGIGVTRIDNNETTNIFTGHIKADINMLNGAVGVSVAREAFTDTPQLIENRIRVINAGGYLSQNLTDRLSMFIGYNHKDYSDRNRSNDAQFITKYALSLKDPRFGISYRFRYLDFNRQSGSGYFDPDDFISHQIVGSLYLEKEKFYIHIEPFGGHQSFKRYGNRSDDLIAGAYGTLGFKPDRNILLEINAEGGNYALGIVTGFRYYMVGFRLLLFL